MKNQEKQEIKNKVIIPKQSQKFKKRFYNTLSNFNSAQKIGLAYSNTNNPSHPNIILNQSLNLNNQNQSISQKPPRQPFNVYNRLVLKNASHQKQQSSLSRLDNINKKGFFQNLNSTGNDPDRLPLAISNKYDQHKETQKEKRSRSWKDKIQQYQKNYDFFMRTTSSGGLFQEISKNSPQQLNATLKTNLRDSSTGFSKTLPSNILQDTEQLYITSMQAKKQNNELEKQVKQLKTRIHNLYEDLAKKDKLIEQFIQGDVQDKYIQESCIVQSYKQQIIELQKKNDLQQEKYEQVMKSLPFTKLIEYEAEMEAYKKECVRLRQKLDTYVTDVEIKSHFKDFSNHHSQTNSFQNQLKEQQLQSENAVLNNQLSELQRENQFLRNQIYELEQERPPIINVNINKKKKTRNVKTNFNSKSEDEAGEEQNLQRNYDTIKYELQKIYANKIRFVLQSLSLQNNEPIILESNEYDKCIDYVQNYLPIVPLIMDTEFYQTQLQGYSTLNREAIASMSQFLITYIKDNNVPLENEIVRITGESIENPTIQTFLKYISYQTMKSESVFPLQVLKTYAGHIDQQSMIIEDPNELLDEQELLASAKAITENLDKRHLDAIMTIAQEGTMIDENTLKTILQIKDENLQYFKNIVGLIQVPFQGDLINLYELKNILKQADDSIQDSMNQKSLDIMESKEKTSEGIQDDLEQSLIREKKELEKAFQRKLRSVILSVGLKVFFEDIITNKNVSLGEKQTQIQVLDKVKFHDLIYEKVINAEYENFNEEFVEKFLSGFQISEKKKEILVYKKLENLILNY